MSCFHGIWIPLITPFVDGAVDHHALRRLVVDYAAAGATGFVALGTTGESASLEAAEQRAVLATILDAAHGLPVVAGVSGNNARHLRERILELNDQALAGVLVPAPCYVRPSQAGLVTHFVAIADASRHPVILYDIPYRTGVRLALPTLLSLAAHANIVAVKDCAGSPETTLAVILDGRLAVMAGEDLNFYSTLCLGGQGAIVASAHLRTADFVRVYEAVAGGRIAQGRALFHALAPLIQALFAEPNPAPVKCALAALGRIRDGVRPPLTSATGPLRDRLHALMGATTGACDPSSRSTQ
ncbi:4-hydroxy-tetrahydrodipicolinate synthase [Robbsia sp. Bb-Pol-6]|uniref:4-hydroxy-tetrahydrodipicolinate synthase n=1 Tax=Robbsia betulipollinis TaxID=2981849 RepID=A0ABT3ZLL3_9BURK|nr:4-hydroxy-tetrahydrodipicolinate synthase [Robbsia betulipollinis]MCY0386840.1 4-hydroxy-tetrahydrodipicolinate synthase [Robbsia betulipollinis]